MMKEAPAATAASAMALPCAISTSADAFSQTGREGELDPDLWVACELRLGCDYGVYVQLVTAKTP